MKYNKPKIMPLTQLYSEIHDPKLLELLDGIVKTIRIIRYLKEIRRRADLWVQPIDPHFYTK